MDSLVIVNWEYSTPDFDNLEFPERDGELVKKLLNDGGYQQTELLQNEEHIEDVVKRFVKKQNEETSLERFHFHYSGNLIFTRDTKRNV